VSQEIYSFQRDHLLDNVWFRHIFFMRPKPLWQSVLLGSPLPRLPSRRRLCRLPDYACAAPQQPPSRTPPAMDPANESAPAPPPPRWAPPHQRGPAHARVNAPAHPAAVKGSASDPVPKRYPGIPMQRLCPCRAVLRPPDRLSRSPSVDTVSQEAGTNVRV